MKFFSSLIVCLCLVSTVDANPLNKPENVHAIAHAGIAYVITHGGQVICTEIAGKEHKLTCTIVAVVAANAANIAHEALQDFKSAPERGIVSGAIGSGLALTFIVIDF